MEKLCFELIIVRHAESEGNVAPHLSEKYDFGNTPLSECGVFQARLVGERLSYGKIDAVYHSPLVRAKSTAEEIIQRQKQMPAVFVFDDLVETDTYREESHAEKQQRAKNCMDEVRSRYKNGETVLFVTHGTFISYLLREALEVADTSLRFSAYNTGVTKIRFYDNFEVKLSYSNDTSHLYADKTDLAFLI